ncbi:MAG: Arc family DNA binding domain-containing protein [Armatimonadetes bacterium]|nr:Arc family DNA binding domain-containing protein [Armatimonadota bacterium]NOG92119.1 Arc family DNA binding domain-containing protein [Armatimonadota bacterium]
MARKSFLLRISPDLWAELQRVAAEEFRSVNAQIEVLLREALKRRGRSLPLSDADSNDGDEAEGDG